jgi:hypothetical protein
MEKVMVNEKVQVTSMGFKKDLSSYPRRMEYQGRTVEFIDAGLRCLVRHGERIAEIITLSDGVQSFRLKSENRSNCWTLLSIAG